LNPVNFATPFGAYDPTVIAEIAKVYNSHRTFNHINLNKWPFNKYLLFVRPVTSSTTVAEAQTWVDEAIAGDHLLVMVFHEILPTAEPGDIYTWPQADFEAFINGLNTKGVAAKTLIEVLNTGTNLVQNGSFETGMIAPLKQGDLNGDGSIDFDDYSIIDTAYNVCGLAPVPAQYAAYCPLADLNGNGQVDTADYLIMDVGFANGVQFWTTDRQSNVFVDSAKNGSYPSPQRSVKMMATTSAVHLFGNKVPVSPAQTYGFRFFVNNNNMTSGELGFFVDEYNATGNWISGKWLGQTGNMFTIDESYSYQPTSAAVASASIQVYLTGGSVGHAFVDGVEMFAR
jgi:hypothetical protein